ncbi:MAG: carbohydrate ABC transporter permease [Sulfobacillus sp.]
MRKLPPYVFVLPSMLLLVTFTLYPLLRTFYLSVFNASLSQASYVGLSNFQMLFSNPVFITALINTLYFVVGAVPLTLAIALVIAMSIETLNGKVQAFFRTVFYLPVITTPVVLSLVWLYIYNENYGLANYLLGVVGIKPLQWLSNASIALPALIMIVITWNFGQQVIIYSAALGNVPVDLYEAAQLDGAGAWAKFRYVTLPVLSPTTLFLVTTNTIAVFQVWIVDQLMTGGGPDFGTETIMYQIYQTAFNSYQFGLASAEAVILFAICLLILGVQFALLRRDIN